MCRQLVHSIKLGCISYQRGLQIQQKYTAQHLEHVRRGRSIGASPPAHTLLLLEHHPVYTIGIRRRDYPRNVMESLRQLEADVFETNRGGLITFHGPGQLVVYPILNLRSFNLGVRDYVHLLEKCVIDLCEQFDIATANTTSDTPPHTGVWIGNDKLAAIGIHVTQHITSHGLAINCNTDLSWFDHIVPCGLVGKGVTSFTNQLGTNTTPAQIMQPFLERFSRRFNCSVLESHSDLG